MKSRGRSIKCIELPTKKVGGKGKSNNKGKSLNYWRSATLYGQKNQVFESELIKRNALIPMLDPDRLWQFLGIIFFIFKFLSPCKIGIDFSINLTNAFEEILIVLSYTTFLLSFLYTLKQVWRMLLQSRITRYIVWHVFIVA